MNSKNTFARLILIMAIFYSTSNSVRAEEVNSDEEILALSPADAEALELNTVALDPKNIKIMGRGVIDRKTGEAVALACVGTPKEKEVGPSCDTLRFIRFSANDETIEELSSAIPNPSAPDSKLQKKALKFVIQEYFDDHQTYSQKRVRWAIRERIAPGSAAGSTVVLLIIFGGAAAPLAVAFPVIVATAVAVHLILGSYSVSKFFSGNLLSGSDVQFTNKNGWNWAVEPNKIAHFRFKRLMGSLKNGNDSDLEQFPEIERRHRRRVHLFEKKGVMF